MELDEKLLAGINFGGSRSGTTVLCLLDELELKIDLLKCDQGEDADEFLFKTLLTKSPGIICINAPLSLPLAYFDSTAEDYLYRECDRELNTQSPMLNGELTARAIKLKNKLEAMGNLRLVETYPPEVADQFKLDEVGYQKDEREIKNVLKALFDELDLTLSPVQFKKWQEVDAFIALFTAVRFKRGVAHSYGNEREGVIYV